MSLNKGKHMEKELDGVMCRVIEENISKERADFLQALLQHNHFDTKVVENETEEGPNTFTLGVTDLLFNPIIYVYELRLKTPDGKVVTPAYWLQKSSAGIEKGEEDNYWNLK
jgi:hypothetical protein